MTNRNDQFRARRSLLAGMGVAAAGVVAGGSAASAQEGRFQPTRQTSDAWMDEMAGGHRVWIDTSYGLGGMEALHYANNILTSHANVDKGKDSDYAMIICWRHYATALGFTDPMWEKYGSYFSAAMQLMNPQTGREHSGPRGPGQRWRYDRQDARQGRQDRTLQCRDAMVFAGNCRRDRR